MLQEKNKEINLIGQGSYGCIFYPGIRCGRKQPKDPKQIVTKIQEVRKSTMDEIEIGKIIQTIPKFQLFFAPIIENCSVNLSTISSKSIEKCELDLKNKKINFMSNKIAYVGKQSIGKYLNKKTLEIMKKQVILKKGTTSITKQLEQIKKFLIKIITTHIYLLESILLLQQKNIIHFDLKENNVMYDEKNDIPIIIDFGLSINVEKLKTVTNYKREFEYSNYETCTQWPIESVFIIYICKNIILSTDKSFISLNQTITSTKNMKESLEKFISKYYDDHRHVGISEELQKRFEVKVIHYLNSFIGKTWKELWDSLFASRNTWDNYSLAQLFHYELYKLQFDTNKLTQYFIGAYSSILINIIVSEPTKRQSIPDTIEQMKEIIRNIKKKEADAINKIIAPIIQTEEYSKSITKIQTIHEYNEVLRDDIIEKNPANKLNL
jgi:serine/threonine protein kinase